MSGGLALLSVTTWEYDRNATMAPIDILQLPVELPAYQRSESAVPDACK